jgi:hypothetical protein
MRGNSPMSPAVCRQPGDDRDGRHQPEVRADVPVRDGGLERREPANRVQSEGSVKELLELLLERVVRGARGHGTEDERR